MAEPPRTKRIDAPTLVPEDLDPPSETNPIAPPPAIALTEAAARASAPADLGAVPHRPDAYAGTTIDGRYLVEKMIGEGGMGFVYLGRHRVIAKKVAIKILRGDMARDQEMVERFLQEARAASAIGNPHIIDVSDFGVLPDGAAYFVMEYLDGMSLSQIMQENRPVPVPRLLHIAKQIARGLSAAHVAGIIHRDLKPDNVFAIARGQDQDFIKILDFGIAKVGSEAARITRAGSVFGTPHYMSPEQAAGASVDSRTDIYALGVILYEMASGKVPFDADNFMGILTQHMYKKPVPVRALVPQQDIPAGLDAIILKCLEKKPDNRYPTMDDLVVDLEVLEKGGMPRAVEDQMQRSGGFNVPADYFRQPAMQLAVPGQPQAQLQQSTKRPRWPMIVALATGGTAAVAALAIVIASNLTHAQPAEGNGGAPDPVVSASPATPPTAPDTAAQAAPTSTAPPAPTSHAVIVITEPLDAKIFRDGKDLGTAPTVKVKDGETVTLSVTHSGFAPQTVKLTSADDPKRIVKLVALPSTHPAGGKHDTAPAPTVTDPDDPWAKHK